MGSLELTLQFWKKKLSACCVEIGDSVHIGFEMQLIEECLPKSIKGIFGIIWTSTKHFGQNNNYQSGPFFL